MSPFPRCGLYAIADTGWLQPGQLSTAVTAAIRGGAGVIQLRDKSGSVTTDSSLLLTLLRICRNAQVPFIINDDPELALSIGADGVHIGRSDADLTALRQQLGRHTLGVSCHNNLEAAVAAEAAGADYVAFGRFFPSRTKPDAVAAKLDLLRQARQRLQLPIVAIGGLTPDNSAAILNAGADTLAVIEGIFGQPDPEAAVRRYIDTISQTNTQQGH
jgi:thiamine-phosphate pyrophosphorylase